MRTKLKKFIDNFEEYTTLLLFFIMCFFVLLQIVTRYLMRNPLSFSDEIARYAYVWLTFIGISLATKHKTHVRVEIVQFLIKGKALVILELCIDIVMILLLTVMLYLGWEYAKFTSVNRWASLPVFSMFLVSVSFPVGCLISVLRMAGRIRKAVLELKNPEVD